MKIGGSEAIFTIGCDPDSTKHGFALFENEKLVSLNSFTLLDMQRFLISFFGNDFSSLEFHLEDNASVKSAYTAKSKKGENLAVKLNIAQKIGMVKQAQIELERMLKDLEIKVVHRKQSKRWKSAEEVKMFKSATGWTSRSNEDTRSAAYFGYVGARERKLLKRSIV
jgi:hypothetical protein